MPNNDPIGGGLLDLINLYGDRLQAELDFKRAQVREQVGARSVMPNVMAQLAQNDQKHRKQQEAIQRQGQQQQPSPQSMLPPQVDVTGGATARSALAGAGAGVISSLMGVSGGGGIKQQGAPGANGAQAGGGGPMMGTLLGGSSVAGAIGQTAPQQVVPPGAIPPGQTPPINPVDPSAPIKQQVDLSGWQRALAGAGALLSVAGRNAEGILEFGSQAVTGKATVGYTTAEKQDALARERLDRVAIPLSFYRSRMESEDPKTREEATQLWENGLEQIRKEGGDDYAQAAKIRSTDLSMIADEKDRRKREDPEYQTRHAIHEQDFEIRNQVLKCGAKGLSPEQCLDPGQMAIFKSNSRAVNITNNMPSPLTKQNVTFAQREVMDNDTMINGLNQLGDTMMTPEGTLTEDARFYFTLPGKAQYKAYEYREWLGETLDPASQKQFDHLATIAQNIAMLNVPYMHKMIGATMSPAELERIDKLLVMIQKSPTENLVAFRELRQSLGLAKFRHLNVLNAKEFQGIDPEKAMPFSRVTEMVREVAEKQAQDMINQGIPKDEAAARQQRMFMSAYGIDIKRIMVGEY